MLNLQLVVIGGSAEQVPEYYKAQAIDELGELGLDSQSSACLLAGDVPAALEKPEGCVYEHAYDSVKGEVMARVTVNLLSGKITTDRAY